MPLLTTNAFDGVRDAIGVEEGSGFVCVTQDWGLPVTELGESYYTSIVKPQSRDSPPPETTMETGADNRDVNTSPEAGASAHKINFQEIHRDEVDGKTRDEEQF